MAVDYCKIEIRWPEESANTPPWGKLARELEDLGFMRNSRELLEQLSERCESLEKAMSDFGVPKRIILDRRGRIEKVRRALEWTV